MLLIACASILAPSAAFGDEEPEDEYPFDEIEEIAIVSPASDSHIFTNRLEFVFAELLPQNELPLPPLDATLSALREGDDEPTVIATGDLRSLMTPEHVFAIWNPAEWEPGHYELLLEVDTGTRILVGTSVVELRSPPVVFVELGESAPDMGGTRVEFAAEAETGSGAEIISYRWDFGDGSPVVSSEEPTVEHVFAAPGTEYTVSVEVMDSLGGSELVVYIANLPPLTGIPPTLQVSQFCGCRQMTVLTQARPQSTQYCWRKKDPLSPGGFVRQALAVPPCPANTFPVKANLGPLDPPPSLGYGFEVEAFLQPGSNPALCTEGQYAMGTAKVGGKGVPRPNAQQAPAGGVGGLVQLPTAGGGTFDFTAAASKPGANVPMPPYVKPPKALPAPLRVFGADDYNNVGNGKKHELPLAIRWVDVPQVGTGGKATSLIMEFVSFVQGKKGTCWCNFQIERTVDAAGVTGGAGLKLLQGLNCRVR